MQPACPQESCFDIAEVSISFLTRKPSNMKDLCVNFWPGTVSTLSTSCAGAAFAAQPSRPQFGPVGIIGEFPRDIGTLRHDSETFGPRIGDQPLDQQPGDPAPADSARDDGMGCHPHAFALGQVGRGEGESVPLTPNDLPKCCTATRLGLGPLTGVQSKHLCREIESASGGRAAVGSRRALLPRGGAAIERSCASVFGKHLG